jgi:hypothetical protein
VAKETLGTAVAHARAKDLTSDDALLDKTLLNAIAKIFSKST